MAYDDHDFEEPDIRKPEHSQPNPDANLTGVEIALCVICSGIGCIMGIVFLIQGKPKAGKMIGLSLLFSFIWGIVRLLVTSA